MGTRQYICELCGHATNEANGCSYCGGATHQVVPLPADDQDYDNEWLLMNSEPADDEEYD